MADEIQETREVRTTDAQVGATNVQRQTVTARSSAPTSVVAQRVVWYMVGFIIALLALRVVLLLFGANRVGFVDFIYSFSGIFAAPFAGIFSTPSYDGKFYLDSASLVAIAVYALVGWGIAKLFTLGSNHPEA